MEENMQAQDEISLAEIFKALLRKIKVLILALLIGVIVGAGFGVVQTINVKYYGTKIDFYVNPRKDTTTTTENNSQYGVYGAYGLHVMDNMVTLLNSELFAERLTLNADGLPLDQDGNLLVNDAALKILVDAALDAKAAAATAQAAVDTAEDAVEDAQEALTLASQELSKATSNKNTIQEELTLAEAKRSYLEAQLQAIWERAGGLGAFGAVLPTTATDEVKEDYGAKYQEWAVIVEKCNTLTDDLTAANTKVNEKQIAKDAATLALQDKKDELEDKKELSIEALAAAQAATEKSVDKWQEMPGYSALVANNRNCVSFSYYDEDEEPENLEDLARSFIYVKISVLNDKAAAEKLYDKVLEIVPIFVQENMAIPSGYDGTKCRRITRDDGIYQTNKGYTTSTAIKYGLLAGAISLVVACVAVILLDRSDKRLRNYEQTMSAFNVPVLGVIPTIESEEENANTKEKNTEAAQ